MLRLFHRKKTTQEPTNDDVAAGFLEFYRIPLVELIQQYLSGKSIKSSVFLLRLKYKTTSEKQSFITWVKKYYQLPIDLTHHTLNPRELFFIGYATLHGLGVAQDIPLAMKIFESAQNANPLCVLYIKHLKNPNRRGLDAESDHSKILNELKNLPRVPKDLQINGLRLNDLAKIGEPQALYLLAYSLYSQHNVEKAAYYFSLLSNRNITDASGALRSLVADFPSNKYICYLAGLSLHRYFQIDEELKTRFTHLIENDLRKKQPHFFNQRRLDDTVSVIFNCPINEETKARISFRYVLIYFSLLSNRLPPDIARLIISLVVRNTAIVQKVINDELAAALKVNNISQQEVLRKPAYKQVRAIITLSKKHFYSSQEGLHRLTDVIDKSKTMREELNLNGTVSITLK